MVAGKKIIVVMPAYNAETTLESTYREIPFNIVDEVILVDDFSRDMTTHDAHRLGIDCVIRHQSNIGYGGNQKTCYKEALKRGADIVVLLHPDYQYTPLLLEAMVYPIARGLYDVMLGSRILGNGALKGGMPLYKYVSNRVLTFLQNLLMGQKLSEYHTGYRAYHRRVLEAIPWQENSDDFIFDNEILAQIFHRNFQVGEVSCPTKYFKEASSIGLVKSIQYGLGCIGVSLMFFMHKHGIARFGLFIKG